MLEIILEGIFQSCFTFSIPTWVVIIAVILACWLIYWDKSFSKLKVKGKPLFSEVTHNSLEISWKKPLFADPEYYIVYYRELHAPEKWDSLRTSDKSQTITLDNLSPNTKYKVKVSACSGTEVGPPGEESDEIITKSLAFKIKLESTLVNGSSTNSISKYAVPRKFENYEEMKIQSIKIGKEDVSARNADRKCILLMSTPHSGKTTLVEGFMNYIFGVNFDDPFRLCLAKDDPDEANHDWIKIYQFDEFEGGRITFPITIIDIPRFCSSRNGDEKQLYKQIHFVMNSVCKEINLLCLVTKGSDFDMSEDQIRYFKSILYSFEDHLLEHFCLFYTFADAGEAHIEEILQGSEITPVKSFHVNWSSLFKSKHRFSPLFWQMNSYHLESFLDFVRQSSAVDIRRKKDMPTPEKREELKNDIATLQPEITKDLSEMGEIKIQIVIFTTRKEEIVSNGDISFTIEEIRQIRKDLEPGVHVTNCMHCFYTCHKNCGIPDDDGKKNCSAMDEVGYCTVCTNHCIWSIHKNTPYIYEYIKEEITKSYQQMKGNYEKEKGKELTYDEYLENLNKDIKALLMRLHGKVQRMAECQHELQGIEQSPIARSVGETIDDLIEAEKRKQEKGFEKRIEMCEELKKYSKLVKISRVQSKNECGVHVQSVCPTSTQTQPQNTTVDAALVKISSGRQPERGFFAGLSVEDLENKGFSKNNPPEYKSGEIRDLRGQLSGLHRFKTCIKVGSSSGLTKGVLHLNSACVRRQSYTLTGQTQNVVIHNQLEICPQADHFFATSGDSGALVFQIEPGISSADDKLICIGMIIGVNSYGYCLATPINEVLERLPISNKSKLYAFREEAMNQ
ncbi:uncharacterized protein LOC133178672 [Saccostrea echinata]|uniref:uncharacterized protein LOC133178672 n=1 Tax=Saccostrea echinata TaxID=191078 RepID=UPI002A83D983|nr:uncharacterized protein LOC133178672 [Saccostrea echinata]